MDKTSWRCEPSDSPQRRSRIIIRSCRSMENCFAARETFEAGLEWLLKAKRLDATLPRLDYDIARTDYTLMDLNDAEEFAARSAAAPPNDVNACVCSPTCSEALEVAGSQDAFQRVRVLKADDAELLLGLGQCQWS